MNHLLCKKMTLLGGKEMRDLQAYNSAAEEASDYTDSYIFQS